MIRSSGSASTEDRPAYSASHPATSRERICLSLRVLSVEAKASPNREVVRNLAGIGWVDAYVVDQNNRDVILVGRRSSAWPSLHLDDLVLAIRSTWGTGSYPYCSLDPRPEDVRKITQILSQSGAITSVSDMRRLFRRVKDTWGPQTVVVGGVPRNSGYAHVLIAADYHMKKLSQGLVQVESIPSCIDIVLADARRSAEQSGRISPMGLSTSRFWFHVGKGEPTYQESEDIVCLDKCSVVVLTEKQRAAADGTLFDAGADDPNAKAFADALSGHLDHAACAVPEYADLINLYRLGALVEAMRLRNAPDKAGLDLKFYLRDFAYQMESPMPVSKPGLANSEEVTGNLTRGGLLYQYVLCPIVCGGVSMDMPITSAQFRKTQFPNLNRLRQATLASRPRHDALFWLIR